MKRIFFLSDAHLGSRAIPLNRMRERRIVHFLDDIKQHALAVYLLGDMIDFWYEYKYCVPKGYTRLLGKLCELTDMGVEVHYFLGNHDQWCGDYLERECGVVIHREMLTTELLGKEFVLAHGDGLDPNDRGYKFLYKMFHSKTCRRLFASIHPRWGLDFGYWWAAMSRKKHEKQEGYFAGEEKDDTCIFSREYLKTHPKVDYFIFGHKHIDVQCELETGAKMIILGDWISKFSFGEFNGEELLIRHYDEGKTAF